MYTWKQYKCWLPKNINVEQDSGLDWLKNILKCTFLYRPIPSSGSVVLAVNPSCPSGQFIQRVRGCAVKRAPYSMLVCVYVFVFAATVWSKIHVQDNAILPSGQLKSWLLLETRKSLGRFISLPKNTIFGVCPVDSLTLELYAEQIVGNRVHQWLSSLGKRDLIILPKSRWNLSTGLLWGLFMISYLFPPCSRKSIL